MQALTIQQPWAYAVAVGQKDVENRSRNTSYRGVVAIHAGQRWSQRGATDPRIKGLPRAGAWHGEGLQTQGAIIALAELVDAHRTSGGCCRPWGDVVYDGKQCWHWRLADVHPLPEPIPCPGKLGLWTVPDRLIAGVDG